MKPNHGRLPRYRPALPIPPRCLRDRHRTAASRGPQSCDERGQDEERNGNQPLPRPSPLHQQHGPAGFAVQRRCCGGDQAPCTFLSRFCRGRWYAVADCRGAVVASAAPPDVSPQTMPARPGLPVGLSWSAMTVVVRCRGEQVDAHHRMRGIGGGQRRVGHHRPYGNLRCLRSSRKDRCTLCEAEERGGVRSARRR